MTPLYIRVKKVAEKRWEGVVQGETLRGLPADLEFSYEAPAGGMEQNADGTFPKPAFTYTKDGATVRMPTPATAKQLEDALMLACIMHHYWTSAGNSEDEPMLIPSADPGEVIKSPVARTRRMNRLST